MCDQVTRWNDIRGIETPANFKEGYRRKYLINTHGIDPDDKTNIDRWIKVIQIYTLPGGDPRRARYAGNTGYQTFIDDLERLKPKPVKW